VQTDQQELQELAAVLDDREAAIKQGMRIGGQRYEVCGPHPADQCLDSRITSHKGSLPAMLVSLGACHEN
jgi:hypothetical protein